MFFNNYNKAGSGIDKNAPKKIGINLFWDIIMREFWGLVKLNLIYILFCIPLVTIGPATSALYKVVILMIRDVPIDIFYEFNKAFKENFKKGFIVGTALFLALGSTFFATYFYMFNRSLLQFPLMMISIILSLSSIYIFPLLSSVEIGIKIIFKNSVLLAIGRLPKTFLVLFAVSILNLSIYLLFPFSAIFLLLFAFSFSALIVSMGAWIEIEKFAIVHEN